jgi:hypothetical protein
MARRPKFYSKASGPVSRDALHAVLRGAEPAYRAHLDAVTGGAWQLREIEGPTENGETLVTWSDGLNDTVILYAIAVTESSVEVRLYVTTPAGPEQPHTGRVAVGQLGDPGAVFGRLHPPFPRGASENPSAFPPGARVLVDGRDEAIVKQAFPQGSSSYGFPHYKVDIVGGDRNVAVAMSRVGVKRRGASENPLDTSVDGWVHWHGPAPDDVGNLGPGQRAQTAAGHWYRQDGGVDAGKLYFQATGDGFVEIATGVIEAVPESIQFPEEDRVGLAPELPPPGELPIGAVENPLGRCVRTAGGTVGRVVEEQGAYGARRRLLELASGRRVWVHGHVYDAPGACDQAVARENPRGGLTSLPPTGARVRLTGTFLKNTGQQRGGEGSKVWTVLGHSGDSFVIVDEEADTSYFTPEEIAADPSLKWRRINKANLQVVGAAPRAGDYP